MRGQRSLLASGGRLLGVLRVVDAEVLLAAAGVMRVILS